jgi:osmoprotectant transport system substrate-binding protein
VNEEDEGNGIIWLDPMWNDNTYALVSWLDFVEEHGLITLSDLASLYREKSGEVSTCIGLEFSTRPDGLPALEKHYNFIVAQSHIMVTPEEIPQKKLENREVDVAMVFGTDAEIAEYGWYIYMDDTAFFPPYDLTPCVRKEVLDTYPEIADILNELVASFPSGGQQATSEIVAEGQKVWQELNAKVNIDGMEPDEVAREYLVENGLIKG